MSWLGPRLPSSVRGALQRASELMRGALKRTAELMRSKRSRVFVFGVCLPCAVVLGPFAVDRFFERGEVLNGVRVHELSLSGLSRQKAVVLIAELGRRRSAAPLKVRVERELFQISPEELGLAIDVAGTADRAVAAGREGSWWGQLVWWWKSWFVTHTVALKAELDERALLRVIEIWEQRAVSDPPVSGSVIVRNGRPEPEYARAGRRIDRPRATQEIASAFTNADAEIAEFETVLYQPSVERAAVDRALVLAQKLLAGQVELTLEEPPITLEFAQAELALALRSQPKSDTELELYFEERQVEKKLAGMRSVLEAEARDATFEVDAADRISILPSQPGRRVAVKEVSQALYEAAQTPVRRGALPVLFEPRPRITTDKARALGISHRVSESTTRHPCCEPRVKNIHLIADLLNGTVVLPGDSFSLNEAIGPRTLEKGFVSAPSIEDKEMVDTVGGGISQFATTLFNAVFHGGYESIERQPHSYWFSRYPMGIEATVSYPKPDLIFRNDTQAGLLIKTSYTATSITVRFYGNAFGRKVSHSVSGRQDVVQPPVELLANPDIAPEKEKVKEAGSVGWSVTVERTLSFPSGTSRSERRKVTYTPRPRRLELHPCRIPEGEPGHTGDPCPIPEPEPEEEEEEQYSEVP